MPMLPLWGWHKLDSSLIIKFTMKNVFCSPGRDEIKHCFGFSLVELLVHRDSIVTVWILWGFAICAIIL